MEHTKQSCRMIKAAAEQGLENGADLLGLFQLDCLANQSILILPCLVNKALRDSAVMREFVGELEVPCALCASVRN